MYLLFKSFVSSLAMDDKKTGRVGKKLIVHLTISVAKWVWTSSLKVNFSESITFNSWYIARNKIGKECFNRIQQYPLEALLKFVFR